MSREILDCLKRQRDICVKNVIPSQNTAFMFTPALKNKFVFSDHSFTRPLAARWQDSLSRGQKSWIFLTSHIDFCSFLDNVKIILNLFLQKSKGHRTSKIVKFRQSSSNGHLPYRLFILLLSARALKNDVAWICVRRKDARKQLARTS